MSPAPFSASGSVSPCGELLTDSPRGRSTALKYAHGEFHCGQSKVFWFIPDWTHTRCSEWARISISSLAVCRHFICIMEGYANHIWWLIWLFKTLAYWCAKEQVILVSGSCALFRKRKEIKDLMLPLMRDIWRRECAWNVCLCVFLHLQGMYLYIKKDWGKRTAYIEVVHILY